MNAPELALRYPDPAAAELTQLLAQAEGVDVSERIVCGNGASELLSAIAHTYPAKRVLLQAPGFYGYERAFRDAGAELFFTEASEESGFSLTETVLGEIEALRPKALVLCNPSNPVGAVVPGELMNRIAQCCVEHGILLLVDECFLPFLPNARERSLISHAAAGENIIVLRAFTKLYAIPGLRLGYAIVGDRAYAERLRAFLPEWNVSTLAQAAGIAALLAAGREDYLKRTRELIEAERAFLTKELTALSCKVYAGAANFLFFRTERPIDRALLERGIAIRTCDNFRGIPFGEDHAFFSRTAIRTHAENEALLSALRSILWQNG